MRKRSLQQKGLGYERFQRKFSGNRRKVSGVEIEAEGSSRLSDIRGFGRRWGKYGRWQTARTCSSGPGIRAAGGQEAIWKGS